MPIDPGQAVGSVLGPVTIARADEDGLVVQATSEERGERVLADAVVRRR